MVDIIDDFEDGGISEYSGDTHAFETNSNSPVYNGSYSLKSTANNEKIFSTEGSGLNYYPQPGDIIELRYYREGGGISFFYGVNGNTNEGYRVQLRQGGEFEVRNYANGNTLAHDTNVNIPKNEWTKVRIEWGSGGHHELYWYDSAGSQLSNISFDHSTHTSRGIGWDVNPNSTNQLRAMDYVVEAFTVPSAPRNVSATVDANDQITLSWDEPSDWGGERGNYRIHISRDGASYENPSGGPTTVNDDGSASYSETYGPNSDTSYSSQVGIDSLFKFRVRAENSAGNSGWSYSQKVYTDPIPPHNPSVRRPDANTVELNWTNVSDIWSYLDIFAREDTGSGYGSWYKIGSLDNTASTTTQATISTSSNSTSMSETLNADARYQFRLRHSKNHNDNSGWGISESVYADYGNQNNVYFTADFETGDFSQWDNYTVSDATYTYVDTSLDGYDGSGRIAESAPEEGSYACQLANGDYVQANLGDLSGESSIIVKAYLQAGSLDSSGEINYVKWYDGSAWQDLHTHSYEYNKQGWFEITALVPSSYLSTDNHVRFRNYPSGGVGDFLCVDRVVVSDVLHEYTKPAAHTNLSLDTATEDEITATWTDNRSLTDVNPRPHTEAYIKRSSDTSYAEDTEGVLNGSHTYTGLLDGEKYDIEVGPYYVQYRHGSTNDYWHSAHINATDITALPAPTGLTASNITADSADLSWTDNHDYGNTKVQYKLSSNSTWNTFSTLSIGVGTETLTNLQNDRQYDARVLANTEHTETIDG